MKLGMRYSYSYWSGGLLIGALLSTGCASAQMRSQVAVLQTEGARQDREIAELESELAARDSAKLGNDLVVDGKAAASSAWTWGSAHVAAAYHTTAEKAAACWNATDFASLHTWDDYTNAASRCWEIQPSASK